MLSRRVLVVALQSCALFGSAVSQHGNHQRLDLEALSPSYDYIVVGGGTGGLVVASRLSEDPDKTVLVVEYGDFANTNRVTVPLFTTQSQWPRLYNFTSVPQAHLNNRTFNLRAGAVLGGSSSVNGMVWDRGSAVDYDSWEALGNPGWNWASLLRYFRKSATFAPPPAEYVERYGFEWSPEAYGHGPVKVGYPTWQWPRAKHLAQGWVKDLGARALTDGAAGKNVGAEWLPQNSGGKEAERSSSETAYYEPAKHRKNLHLLVRHYGAAVKFNGHAVSGVEIASRDYGKTRLIKSRGVVLSAGAVNTPRILQLSGIGPRKLLESHGIHVIVDSPGVGANLQDQPAFAIKYNYTNESYFDASIMTSNATFYNSAWDEYVANRTGPFSHAWGNRVAFTSLQDLDSGYKAMADGLAAQNPLKYLPPIYSEHKALLKGFLNQREAMQGLFRDQEAGVVEYAFGGGERFTVAVQKPLSRGTIFIRDRNPDPSVPPLIDFQGASNPIDMEIAVLALKKAREVMASASMAVTGPVETRPGPAAADDSQIEAALRDFLLDPSFDHPVGTAAMMPRDLGGVVSTGLGVYGVQGLWVADASVMPLIPAAHTQASVYAIAEYAADLIKGSVGYA